MPINNGSLIWPKIMICSTCKQPVEREPLGRFKIREHRYLCQACDAWVPGEDTEWRAVIDVPQVVHPKKVMQRDLISKRHE